MGKTVITLTAIDRLIHDWGFVRRVLVIAPKKVAEATWQAEAAKWDHLSRLTLATALGTAQERAATIDSGADVTIINRENVVEETGRHSVPRVRHEACAASGMTMGLFRTTSIIITVSSLGLMSEVESLK